MNKVQSNTSPGCVVGSQDGGNFMLPVPTTKPTALVGKTYAHKDYPNVHVTVTEVKDNGAVWGRVKESGALFAMTKAAWDDNYGCNRVNDNVYGVVIDSLFARIKAKAWDDPVKDTP
jgi:hypothetical protein